MAKFITYAIGPLADSALEAEQWGNVAKVLAGVLVLFLVIRIAVRGAK